MKFKPIEKECVDPITGAKIDFNGPVYVCPKCGIMYGPESYEATNFCINCKTEMKRR